MTNEAKNDYYWWWFWSVVLLLSLNSKCICFTLGPWAVKLNLIWVGTDQLGSAAVLPFIGEFGGHWGVLAKFRVNHKRWRAGMWKDLKHSFWPMLVIRLRNRRPLLLTSICSEHGHWVSLDEGRKITGSLVELKIQSRRSCLKRKFFNVWGHVIIESIKCNLCIKFHHYYAKVLHFQVVFWVNEKHSSIMLYHNLIQWNFFFIWVIWKILITEIIEVLLLQFLAEVLKLRPENSKTELNM